MDDIESYRGSVIGFSGDAITGWFDGENESLLEPQPKTSTALRATASALAIQQTMQRFAQVDIPGVVNISLAIKVVVTVGPRDAF